MYYTIKTAIDSAQFDKIVISSEDDEILSYAMKMDVIPSKRPDKLSLDDVHSINVILDYIKAKNISPNTFITMLLPTSPLRTSQDIKQALKIFKKSNADSLVSVYESSKHIMNFRYINKQGCLETITEGERNVQRQDMKKLYVVNGSIYISTVKNLLKNKSYHIGKIVPYIMPHSRSIDINTIEDIKDVKRIIKL